MNNVVLQKNLTPHHVVSFSQLYSLKIRKLAITQMGKEQNFSFYPSAISKTGDFQLLKDMLKLLLLIIILPKSPS